MEDIIVNKCFACGKDIIKEKSCSCCGHIYCAKHYQQMIKYGHCLDSNPRTTKDMNDFEFVDEKTIKIITYNQKSEYSGSFLISPEDFERVIVKKWRIWKNRVYTGNFKVIVLHRFLLEEELSGREWMVIDHINSNPLDNRRENLRITTQAKNVLNKRLPSTNSTGIVGVYYDKGRNMWASEIRISGGRWHLGRWKKIEDAVYARYFAETLLFKEYRSTQNDNVIFPLVEKCRDCKQIEKFVMGKIGNFVDSTHKH